MEPMARIRAVFQVCRGASSDWMITNTPSTSLVLVLSVTGGVPRPIAPLLGAESLEQAVAILSTALPKTKVSAYLFVAFGMPSETDEPECLM